MNYKVKSAKKEEITELELKEVYDGSVILNDVTHGWHILVIRPDGVIVRQTGVGADSGFQLDERGRVKVE